MKPLTRKDKDLLAAVLAFLEYGGSRESPFVQRFCHDLEMTDRDLDFHLNVSAIAGLKGSMAKKLVESLRKVGLVA